MRNIRKNKAFTIVELVVVVSVIGILAAIIIVGYGAWRTSVATSSIKSDLVGAAAAMESARTFSGVYPSAIPSSFAASENNILTLTESTDVAFCIDGTTTNSASILYYIDELTRSNGATEGTCVARTSSTPPATVTNVGFTTASTAITVNWSLASPNYATAYAIECARDPVFISGLLKGSVTSGTATSTVLSGANPQTTYYCRVQASNANGQSGWSGTGSGNTQQTTCADNGQFGTYPTCYDYDSFLVGTSISGYWSTPPSQYLLEDGSAVSRTTYAELFAMIGTTYGSGDGSTTFNLPDSSGRAPVNLSSSDSMFDTMGEKYGEKSHTITLSETPSHSHGQYVTANASGSGVRRDYSSDGSGYLYAQGQNTGTAGSSAASNVIQPSIVKQYAIKWRPSTGSNSTLPTGTTLQGYWASDPVGYRNEIGDAISRGTYSDLFNVIGSTYGAGNGSTTFNIPNSRGLLGVNRNSSDSQFATLGQVFGEKTHVLTIAEMDSHTHAQYATSGSGGGAIRNDFASDGTSGAFTQGANTGSAGSGQAFNVMQPTIVKRSTIKTQAVSGSQVDSGIVAGTSIEGWWSAAPTGFLLEDGAAVSRTTYSDLFAVIGTNYGSGNGSTTFNVPDARGRVAVNKNALDTEFATIGQKFGEKTHIQSASELFSHSHAQYVTANSGGPAIRRDYAADGSGYSYWQGQYTGSSGSGAAYNVIQPSITKMFAIKF